MSNEESEAVVKAYQQRLSTILPIAPPSLRELATSVNIHDGLIEWAEHYREKEELNLKMIIGDQQRGYSCIHLYYFGVSFDSSILEEIANDSTSEALYDEVDVEPDGHFTHRILFHPYRELEISFSSLMLSLVPRSGQNRKHVPARFISE